MLPKLMACPPAGLDALFESEIQKYAPLAQRVAANVAAQDKLLAALRRDQQVRLILNVEI